MWMRNLLIFSVCHVHGSADNRWSKFWFCHWTIPNNKWLHGQLYLHLVKKSLQHDMSEWELGPRSNEPDLPTWIRPFHKYVCLKTQYLLSPALIGVTTLRRVFSEQSSCLILLLWFFLNEIQFFFKEWFFMNIVQFHLNFVSEKSQFLSWR